MIVAPHILITFTLIAFMAAAMPGPDNIYIVSQGAARGFKAGMVATLGVMTGLCVHITVASLGLTALFATSVAAYEILRWIGVAYLVYLAWKIMAAPPGEGSALQNSVSRRRIFAQGLLTNLLNPKIVMFFLALIPQFVDVSRGHVAAQTAVMGFIIMGTGFIVFTVMNAMAAKTGGALRRSERARKIQNYIFGGALGGSALLLALADRK